MNDSTRQPPLAIAARRTGQLASLEALEAIPDEEIWLAKQKSARTRRAYRLDVVHFMRTHGITSREKLRQIDHRAVIARERIMHEQEGATPSTVRRRVSALSSLFEHLMRHGSASRNPVVDVERPATNCEEGTTAAFSKMQARQLLDAPPIDNIAGLRDGAILSVGLQVGLRRAEIAALIVGDLHQNRGYDAFRSTRKGGRRDALAINSQAAARIRAYLDLAGHGTDHDGPMFRPLQGNARAPHPANRMDPYAVDRVLSTRLASGSYGATRRTRCGRHSLPRRWRTGRSSRTCRKPLVTAIRPPPSSMTGGGTTPSGRQASSQPISFNPDLA